MMTKHQIRTLAWVGAVLFLTSALMDALLRRHMVDADTVVRVMGVVKGLIIIACANQVPKRLPPLESLYCDPAHDLAYRRILGWLGIATGVVFTLAFVFAPVADLRTIAICVLLPILFVAAGLMARVVWARFFKRRTAS